MPLTSMKRRRRDPYADETTIPYDDLSVPVAISEEDDETRPVDVEEMEVAARRSTEVTEPHDPTPLPATRTSPNARPRTFVELQVAGGAVITLPVHRLSQTGVILVVPPGVPIDLPHDTAVTAVLHLMRTDEEMMRARLPAHVAHHRHSTGSAPGGLSLRWDLTDAGARRAVEALLASAI